jgi:hypothetical protein
VVEVKLIPTDSATGRTAATVPAWLTYDPQTRDISVETTDLSALGNHIIWIKASIVEHPGPIMEKVFFWNIVNEGITLPTTTSSAPIASIRTEVKVDLNLVPVWKGKVGGKDFPNAISGQLITTEYDDFVIFDSNTLELRLTYRGYKKYCSKSANKPACA